MGMRATSYLDIRASCGTSSDAWTCIFFHNPDNAIEWLNLQKKYNFLWIIKNSKDSSIANIITDNHL